MSTRITRWAKRGGYFGAFLGAAALADSAFNDDLDDLYIFPKRIYNSWTKDPKNRKRVVVLGTGWGCTGFLRKVDPALWDVTIVSPRNHFFYTPMLTGVAAGTVKAASIMEGTRTSWPMPEATYYRAQCSDLDVAKQEISVVDCCGENKLHYDKLIIGVGAEPNTFGIKGVAENAFFLKELCDSTRLRKQILDTLEDANVARMAGRTERLAELMNFVIVGGGPTGVEFSAELSDFVNNDVKKLYPDLHENIGIYLLEAFPGILNVFDKQIGAQVEEHLKARGVTVMTNSMVTGATKESVEVKGKDGTTQTIPTHTLVWTGGIRARPITTTLGKAISASEQADRRGLVVDECLRVKGAPKDTIFALGDCAFSGKPPTAQVAAQQGAYLGRQFRDNEGEPAAPFAYQHKGALAYIGDNQGAAQLPRPKFGGDFFAKLYEQNAHTKMERTISKMNAPEASTSAAPEVKKDINIVGRSGFAIWRSVYWAKVMTYRNRYNVTTDWLRSVFFGRDVSSSLQTSFQQTE